MNQSPQSESVGNVAVGDTAPSVGGDLPCACGYNLRGLPHDGECPECGDRVATARQRLTAGAEHRLFLTRLTLGMTILVWAAPLLTAAMLIWRKSLRDGLPLAGLNFAGPKPWATPVLMKYGNSGITISYPVVALVVLNTFGIWLLTTARPSSDTQQRSNLLRRLLRGCTVAGVAFCWAISDSNWIFIDVPYEKHVLVTVLVAEIPCTLLLYLYLERLARSVGCPSLAGRFRRIRWAVVGIAAISLLSLTGASPLTQSLPKLAVVLYAVAVVVVGFIAADLLLELRNELKNDPVHHPARATP